MLDTDKKPTHEELPRGFKADLCEPGIDNGVTDNLYAELIHCATLACATAKVIGQAIAIGARCTERTLTVCLPPAPSCFPAVAGFLLEHRDVAALGTTLRAYYECQRIASTLTVAGSACAKIVTSPVAAAELVILASVWQGVAAAGLLAVFRLTELLPDTRHGPALAKLRIALDRVSKGEAAWLGESELGPIASIGERRAIARTVVNTKVLVERGASILGVLVVNASGDGIGVMGGIDGLRNGECMRVLWRPGVYIPAKVAWTSGLGFGLEFAEPSAHADAFLSSLLEGSRLEQREAGPVAWQEMASAA